MIRKSKTNTKKMLKQDEQGSHIYVLGQEGKNNAVSFHFCATPWLISYTLNLYLVEKRKMSLEFYA